MSKCVICGKDSIGECCSGACRAKKSRRTQERTDRMRTVEAHAAKGVIVDARGTEHLIDYEGRRKDYELLESWVEGKGSEYQKRMGLLARHYRAPSFDLNRYLGV